ncbi:MAG: helix-turn-helix transcriptional regulator [Betaproteobacteria bacterium]|nr:helix-turn-helix transcriptional regulator [Betaproteobacteria bacterium]
MRAGVEHAAKALGEQIREARIRANLTQIELAAELEIAPRSLQEYEAGRQFPQPKRRRRISAFLSVHKDGGAT